MQSDVDQSNSIPLWRWGHQRHRHGTGFAGLIQQLLLSLACSWSPSVAWQDEIKSRVMIVVRASNYIRSQKPDPRSRLGRSHADIA